MALQALYQFVVEGKCPAPQLKLAPHFVMRSTLDLFLDFMPAEAESWTEQLYGSPDGSTDRCRPIGIEPVNVRRTALHATVSCLLTHSGQI